MRYGAHHAEETRRRVLDIAAAQIRALGPDGVSVAGLMREAGLTHGGFYAHFASKEDLVAQAVATMFDQARALFLERVGDKTGLDALEIHVRYYLARAHRDRPDIGCPVAALANDIARQPAAVREAFDKGVAGLTARMAGLLTGMVPGDPLDHARGLLNRMVGAVALSRAIADRQQSDAVLQATRRDLIDHVARLASGAREDHHDPRS